MGCGGSKTDNTVQQQREVEANNNKPAKQQTDQKSRKSQKNGTSESTRSRDRNRNRSQPVNEKGYKKRIRENLRHATAGDDIDVLEKNMDVFEKNHLEDGGDYEDAEERLDFLKTRKEIRDACMRKHPVVLEKTIQKVESSPYKRQLKPYLDKANYLLRNSEDRQKFKHNISELDQATVSEVKSYNHPPPGVHETMIATYMVCGYPEEHLTKDWTEITTLMSQFGNHHLLREVKQAEGRQVDQDVALRARNYLGTHTLEEIREGSNGAAAFHVWASRMVGKHEGKRADSQGTKPLSNSGGKGQQPGQRGNRDPNTPKTPSTPSKFSKDNVQEKKQMKEEENKAKQTKNIDNKTKTSVNNNKQVLNNTQTGKNAKQTTQQANAVANKTTKKG